MPLTLSSEMLQVAEAVKERLNAGDFTQDIQAVLRVLPRFRTEEIEQEQRLVVAPRTGTARQESRNHSAYEYRIDVALQSRLSPDASEEAAVDASLLFLQEVEVFMRYQSLPDFEAAKWTSSEWETAYSDEHLESLRQVTSVLTLVYQVRR